MYKSDWEEKKYSRHSKNKPSFSSTLLDQIYRSIDDHDDDDHHKFKTSSKTKISWPEDNFFFKYSQTIKPVRTSSSAPASAKCREDDHDIIKFKSKIYAHLKKVKQPISPGGRLTNFLNSLFHNKQLQPKNNNTGNHSRAHKYCICSATNNIHINALRPGSLIHSRQRDHDEDKSTQKHHHEEDEDEDLSDSSSDLFELDVFANDQLPVYETTRLDTTKRTHDTVPRFNIP